VLIVKFTDRMVPEVVQTPWAALQPGEFTTDAATAGEQGLDQYRP